MWLSCWTYYFLSNFYIRLNRLLVFSDFLCDVDYFSSIICGPLIRYSYILVIVCIIIIIINIISKWIIMMILKFSNYTLLINNVVQLIRFLKICEQQLNTTVNFQNLNNNQILSNF